MSHSSGVFTFPGTGYWLVSLRPYTRLSSSDAAARMTNISMNFTTTNNFAQGHTPLYVTQGMEVISSDTTFSTAYGHVIIDITDTSNDKVRFSFSPSDPNYTGRLVGATGAELYSWVSFIRLGDT